MKLTGTGLLGLLCLALGGGLLFEIARNRDQAARVNELKHGLAVQRSATRELTGQIEGLQEQKDALTARALHAEKALAEANAAAPSPSP